MILVRVMIVMKKQVTKIRFTNPETIKGFLKHYEEK